VTYLNSSQILFMNLNKRPLKRIGMMSEAACQLVSSRGLMKSCDVYPPHPVSSTRLCYDYDWASLKPGASVYVIGSAVPHFLMIAWDAIKVPFVLVTGDCDLTMPDDLFTRENLALFLAEPKLLAWFSQNLVTTHSPKLHRIPIGMDYHTLAEHKNHPWGPQQSPIDQEQILIAVRDRAMSKERQPIAYANFQFSMTTRYAEDRRTALAQLPPALIHYESMPVSRFITWAHQSKFELVISPHGGGLDCHRTWEALALGCYPIVKSSPLDPLFEKLPVLIVKEWSDVTQERLFAFLREDKNIQKEQLTLKWWTDQFKRVDVPAASLLKATSR